MNSQNRMNAGAEYVVYRIWAALQDRDGIHAESLLTCLGALAGYACQVCVRETAALPGADPDKYALTAVDAADGATYLHGEALNATLVENPLSVWALVSRVVHKLDEPLPDIQDILTHATHTLGTSAFGIPRVPWMHRPRHAAIFYLKQLWPQILPIARRFCSKPRHLPTLFGVALQRAIESTQDRLSPTLGASIAMECAVAMSKVVLPDSATTVIAARPTMNRMPLPSVLPIASLLRETEANALRIRAPVRKRRRVAEDATSTAGIRALVARVPPAARVGTIVSFALVVTLASAMHRVDRREAPVVANVVPTLKIRQDIGMLAEPAPAAPRSEEPQFPTNPPSATPDEAVPPQTSESSPPPSDPSAGNAEIVIPDS